MSTIAFKPKMGGEWYDISFRYDPDLVTLIKSTIPPAFRKWDPSNKMWSASKMWAQAFAAAARSAGHTTAGIPDATGSPSGASPFGTAPGAGTFFGAASAGAWSQRSAPRGSRQPPPQPPKPPPPPPQLTENWAKELMRRTSPELREKVYRALAKVLHEDLGGDGRLMQELNDARNGLAS